MLRQAIHPVKSDPLEGERHKQSESANNVQKQHERISRQEFSSSGRAPVDTQWAPATVPFGGLFIRNTNGITTKEITAKIQKLST